MVTRRVGLSYVSDTLQGVRHVIPTRPDPPCYAVMCDLVTSDDSLVGDSDNNSILLD